MLPFNIANTFDDALALFLETNARKQRAVNLACAGDYVIMFGPAVSFFEVLCFLPLFSFFQHTFKEFRNHTHCFLTGMISILEFEIVLSIKKILVPRFGGHINLFGKTFPNVDEFK